MTVSVRFGSEVHFLGVETFRLYSKAALRIHNSHKDSDVNNNKLFSRDLILSYAI